MSDRKRQEYALYKGDKLLAIGTSNEICEQMNISIKTFWYYSSKFYEKNRAKNKETWRTVVKINDGEW